MTSSTFIMNNSNSKIHKSENKHITCIDDNAKSIDGKGSETPYRFQDSCNKKKKLWTKEEDEKLRKIVAASKIESKRGYQWTIIAKTIDGRSGKQCRERWHNHLKPEVRKGDWTEEEDAIIIKMQGRIGNHWTKITEMLPGRTDNDIKNRWHSCVRNRNKENAGLPLKNLKVTSYRKSKTNNKVKGTTVLQEINFDRNSTPKPTTLRERSRKRKPLKSIVFYDKNEAREQVEDPSSTTSTRTINDEEIHQKYDGAVTQRPKKKRKGGELSPFPRIYSDTKSLRTSYGHLLSPVRRENKTSLADKIYNSRLQLQEQISLISPFFSPEVRTPVVFNKCLLSQTDSGEKEIDLCPIDLFPSPVSDQKSSFLSVQPSDWLKLMENDQDFNANESR